MKNGIVQWALPNSFFQWNKILPEHCLKNKTLWIVIVQNTQVVCP